MLHLLSRYTLSLLLCVLVAWGSGSRPVHAADAGKSLVVIFGHEGGLQCNPGDPGNWTGGKVGRGVQGCTKYGIAPNTYPSVNIRKLSLTDAAALYRRDFWTPLHLSELESQGIATEILDTAVNCGVGTSANMVLKAINALAPAHYKMTGKLNSEQIEWINKYTRNKNRRVIFWKVLNVYQAERYLYIIDKNPKMRPYINSWFSRVGG